METKPTSTQAESSDTHQGATQRCGANGKGRRRAAFIFTLAVALTAGLAGGYVGKSFAHGGPGHAREGMAADPTKMDQHVEHMINRLASKVDASPEQKAKLSAIAKSAVKDLAPLREKAQAARKQAITLLAAANVDRSALERLRAEQIQLADSVSKRVTQALADAADVLTPAQRTQLAERMQHGNRRGGWHHD